NSKLIFKPRQATVPFPSRLYDDFCNERKGSYGLKDLDAYSIRTTFHNDSLPIKEKDSGSFTLPCFINNVCFEKSLADLGASVSVTPLSTYLNLVLDELAHTKLTVELADRTVKHPKGIAENVLVGIVVEDMDPYLDEGMGDVIVGEPFYKASCMEAKRFDGIITIRDGDDSVTYQMVRANSRFKHLTNEKCNKIPPLLKVSEQEKMNGISHSYQKLKGFYKGVLNRGPEFIRDAKVEEWLTRGHISVHEME
ncbi:homeodomain-like protein, partial [Tanacetum coccineum]